MKGLRTVIGVLLAVGLIIGFAGCEDQDTISKADRCSSSIIKFQKNDCDPWSVEDCLYYPNATVNCVLNASGENELATCDEMWDCVYLAGDCEDALEGYVYDCGLDDELGLENWYDAWEQCVTEWDLDCIFAAGTCDDVAACFGLELPPL